jgi:hypothetical protein
MANKPTMYRKSSTTAETFAASGLRKAEFFNHRVAVIPKQYPATFLLFEQRGVPQADLNTGSFYQINLYSPDICGFPDELFTDRKVNWHNQQLGQSGLIAAAGLYLQGSSLVISIMQSDLCQQLYRHVELKQSCKTQVGKRFGAWHRVLFNAILDFASENGLASVYTPTADWILASTKKQVQPGLFRRIYDSVVSPYHRRKVTRDRADYWEIPLVENEHLIAPLAPYAQRQNEGEREAWICLFHDIEEDVDTEVSKAECAANLGEMLHIEKSRSVQATYNVLGTLFAAKRQQIEGSDSGHCLAFHSSNHDLNDENQLAQCRKIDLQVRGYRPPQSVITPELSDYRLSFLDFEWLASGERSLGSPNCTLHRGIVKIPIFTDDYPLFTGQLSYADWERRIVDRARSRKFVAFGLHDCYGKTWLNHYGELLDKLRSFGTLVTADQVCDSVYREHYLPCNGGLAESRHA